jgi:hypothetical protein
MTVLWLALGLYIIGVALVLYIRPNSMFYEGGWKEFGLANTNSYTVFPFWMFTLVWAVLSYAFATLAMMFFASSTLHTMPAVESDSPVAKPISRAAPAAKAPKPPKMPKPAAPATASSPTSPGYYVLDTPVSGGPPRYVYYGPEPPSIQNLERFAA